jgi:hypothetical protein
MNICIYIYIYEYMCYFLPISVDNTLEDCIFEEKEVSGWASATEQPSTCSLLLNIRVLVRHIAVKRRERVVTDQYNIQDHFNAVYRFIRIHFVNLYIIYLHSALQTIITSV